MASTYNADEVLRMAEEIERRGEKFYRQAAENAATEDLKSFFLELAHMEHSHLETFGRMRQAYESGQGSRLQIFDPDSETVYYLQDIAASHGWEGMAGPDHEFTGKESVEDILHSALDAEKGSINFYLGLKQSIQSQSGRDEVEAIIQEEMSHVARLNKYLMEMGNSE